MIACKCSPFIHSENSYTSGFLMQISFLITTISFQSTYNYNLVGALGRETCQLYLFGWPFILISLFIYLFIYLQAPIPLHAGLRWLHEFRRQQHRNQLKLHYGLNLEILQLLDLLQVSSRSYHFLWIHELNICFCISTLKAVIVAQFI